MAQQKLSNPIGVFYHEESDHLAVLGRTIQSLGLQVHLIRQFKKDPIPELNKLRGCVGLGGPMSANDELSHPWIEHELPILRKILDLQLPYAGLCLGAQLLARALGATVTANPESEVGWLPINLTEQGRLDPVFRGLEQTSKEKTVLHWHQDTFALPPGATLLASTPKCARQAFKIGESVYGFQFHPEGDVNLTQEWKLGDSEIQKARENERNSLILCAGLAGIFLQPGEGYSPIDCTLHDQILAAIVHKREVQIHDPILGKTKGILWDVVTLPGNSALEGKTEWAFFRDSATGISTPFRLDRLTQVCDTNPSRN